MTGGLAVILGPTGRNLGAGMSGGTAYIYRLEAERVNREALASGELLLSELDAADAETLRELLTAHALETGSVLAAGVLEQFDSAVNDFVRVLPRDYAAVRDLRRDAVATGLDPDGETVWNRILEVTGG